ncbi:hypothetical protein RvY_09585 [Ramazzottius varieornatus]|uniref:Uncharacterized protein n=1 Tax=Ramazzottius varieornatus TaxID=947166 RepID=A0A1D1V9W6_RAMVA|nr:hypothetical protein RvY_09585 [Ramazzottius varieornatus]
MSDMLYGGGGAHQFTMGDLQIKEEAFSPGRLLPIQENSSRFPAIDAHQTNVVKVQRLADLL